MQEYDELNDDVAFVRVESVGVVALQGPDAMSFLQSLASQDLDGLAIGETRHSLLLEPQGKLTADFRVVRVADDELWLRCEPEVAPVLAAGLARFKIRVKVDIEDCSATMGAIAIRGPQSHDVQIDLPIGACELAADWPTNPGREVIGALAAVSEIAVALVRDGVAEADPEALETLRIEHGIPRQPADIDERTIAQEAYLERTAVSFTKGCFLGQELVCRIDTRGHVNRMLRRLRPATPVDVGADVRDANDKVVGVVSSAAVSPRSGPVALATLRREVEPDAEVSIASTTAVVLD
jgi:folate-binding protein YgfZ